MKLPQAGSSAPFHRALAALLFGAAALYYAQFIYRSGFSIAGEMHFCLYDDAMISMRYARHLAQGFGLVWNPGEPPIEGFSNLLWTLAMGAVHLLPLAESKTALAMMIAGAAILLANGWVTWRLAAWAAGNSPLVVLTATSLTLLSYPLAHWTLMGMEAGLLALLIGAAALQAIRLTAAPPEARWRAQAAGLACLALALLTRPDAIVPVAVVAGFQIAALPAGTARRRGALWTATALLAVMVGLALFRRLYFGDWMPNTYYLKVAGVPLEARLERGLESLWFTVTHQLWLPLALAAAWLWPGRPATQEPQARHAWQMGVGLIASMMAYSVYVGGDAWEFYGIVNRYLALALPALYVACALGLSRMWKLLGENSRRAAAWPWLLLAALAVFHLGSQGPDRFAVWLEAGGRQKQDHEGYVRLGLFLREATAPDAAIAVVWAGATPYFAQRRAIDLLGKNDRAIARGPLVADHEFSPGHSKWNYPLSIGRNQPDVIAPLYRPTAADFAALEEMGYSPLSNALYAKRGSSRIHWDTIGHDWSRDDAAAKPVSGR